MTAAAIALAHERRRVFIMPPRLRTLDAWAIIPDGRCRQRSRDDATVNGRGERRRWCQNKRFKRAMFHPSSMNRIDRFKPSAQSDGRKRRIGTR